MSERKSRKIEYVNNQLKYLYEPLYCFSSYAEQLFELSDNIQKLYKSEYAEKNWSQEKTTQENLKIETTNAINVSNEYISNVVSNNNVLKKIIEDNFSYSDLDDVDIFKNFIKDFTRYRTEYDENGALKLPHRIFFKLNNISFLKPEFIQCVKSKYEIKQKELKKYQAK
ncbi:MAG: hypothetical protein IH819_13065 [Bacteroidetes bacterium]|nr:hypothetical protein [Bacteroidota bacterium]